MQYLNPQTALIFRITHIDNLPWILASGLHCQRSTIQDPHFRPIGNPDIISKRLSWPVPIPPGGTLADYVPFYFTPCSIMLYNIVTGYGVEAVPRNEIITFVSDLPGIAAANEKFAFTDQHALLKTAQFYADLADLTTVDWKILQACDFKRDPNDPAKKDRYQAEALIHKHVPLEKIRAIGCYSDTVKSRVDAELQKKGISHIMIMTQPSWFFA